MSGELPDATSVTAVRKALASAAVRSARPAEVVDLARAALGHRVISHGPSMPYAGGRGRVGNGRT